MISRNRATILYSVFFYPIPIEQRDDSLALHCMAFAVELCDKLIDTEVGMMDQLDENEYCLGL
jgi:hypothetical protein